MHNFKLQVIFSILRIEWLSQAVAREGGTYLISDLGETKERHHTCKIRLAFILSEGDYLGRNSSIVASRHFHPSIPTSNIRHIQATTHHSSAHEDRLSSVLHIIVGEKQKY